MDVREKLVELVRHEVVPYFAERIADNLIAHGVTVQDVPDNNVGKWISVKDRLPDVCDSYIVCGKMKYSHEKEWEIFTDVAGSHGDYIDGFWDTFNDWNEGQEIHITHWMPLPQPPKGE